MLPPGRAEPPRIPTEVDLAGLWSGEVYSPLGSVPCALRIESKLSAMISTLNARERRVEDFSVERGRIRGHVHLEVPQLDAEYDFHLRLQFSPNGLVGVVIVRTEAGEAPLPAKLLRESVGEGAAG